MKIYSEFFKYNFADIQQNNPKLTKLEINIQIAKLWEQASCDYAKITDDQDQEYFKYYDSKFSQYVQKYELAMNSNTPSCDHQISNTKNLKQYSTQGTIIQINYCQSDPKFILEARKLDEQLLKHFKRITIRKCQLSYESKNIEIIFYNKIKNVLIWSCLQEPLDLNKIITRIKENIIKNE